MTYPVHHMLGAQRNGVNSTGMELGKADYVTGPIQGTNYPASYPTTLLDWYRGKGVTSVRIVFSWEAVQKDELVPIPPAGPANNFTNYWDALIALINAYLARDIYVVLAPWQYNKIIGDTDITYKGAAFTSAHFSDFWKKFALAVNAAVTHPVPAVNPRDRVGFDLINEPHEKNSPNAVGITINDWFDYAKAAIKAIRDSGNNNTIFVPGMDYAAASRFVLNGSAAQFLAKCRDYDNVAVTVHCYTHDSPQSPTVVRDACADVVNWARDNSVKVHVGEIAINAGPNGQATYAGTFAAAQAQWANWVNFCLANSDVIVGWNWWANGVGGWWGVGDSTAGHNWALTTNNGTPPQTVYADLILPSMATPLLQLRDNPGDTGAEPNVTVALAYESPDIWVRRSCDGGLFNQNVAGNTSACVYVKVSNRGPGTYAGGKDVIRLFWAKAESGLSWPAPWDSSTTAPSFGGTITSGQPIGAIPPGESINVDIEWSSTPDPASYPNKDGHFCLLAFIVKPGVPSFDGFEGPNLNANVLRSSRCAWCNIHISPVGSLSMGSAVLANNTSRVAQMQANIETLDALGKPSSSVGLILSAQGMSLRKLAEVAKLGRFLKDMGHGNFALGSDAVMPPVTLHPGEKFWFNLKPPANGEADYAVRVTQYQVNGSTREIVGGQTFVVGAVVGYTEAEVFPSEPMSKPGPWWWLVAAVIVLLGTLAWWVL